MAKIFITDTSGDNPVPFLRGILTRSLTDAGLAFEDAYQLASDIRQRITGGISRDGLRTLVLQELRAKGPSFVAESYEAARSSAPGIQVRDTVGELQPFSRNEHMRCLAACGLSEEQAGTASSMLMEELSDRQQWLITTEELRALSYYCLKIHFGERAAERYRIWMDFTHSGRPLILLIGGGTGSGKSTIATELAHRLGIVRTQSTDMLREVMRMLIPERIVPVLHRSSFDAGSALPIQHGDKPNIAERVAEGYQRQLELLAVPCEAVIARAIRERVWLIVEGVHVHPTLASRLSDTADAVVVSIMLGVLRPDELRARLTGRRRDAPGRNTRVDPANFKRIWELQAYLLAEADRVGAPILINDDKDSVTTLVLRTVIDVLDAGNISA
jgi:2-phosphoglycerate kinase